MKKKWNNSALNCEAYSSFEDVSSDHRIVTPKILLSLRRKVAKEEQPYTMTGPCLKNRNITDKYTFTL